MVSLNGSRPKLISKYRNFYSQFSVVLNILELIFPVPDFMSREGLKARCGKSAPPSSLVNPKWKMVSRKKRNHAKMLCKPTTRGTGKEAMELA